MKILGVFLVASVSSYLCLAFFDFIIIHSFMYALKHPFGLFSTMHTNAKMIVVLLFIMYVLKHLFSIFGKNLGETR